MEAVEVNAVPEDATRGTVTVGSLGLPQVSAPLGSTVLTALSQGETLSLPYIPCLPPSPEVTHSSSSERFHVYRVA